MAPPIPNCPPTRLTAGDTFKWTQAAADYPPADGWVLTFRMRGPGNAVDVAGTANTSDYSFVVAASVTATLTPGTYTWDIFAVLGTERYTVVSGELTLTANLQTATTITSHAATMLAQVESEILARIPGNGSAHSSYSIGGRSISKMSDADLRKWRRYYQDELYRERNPTKNRPVRFGRFCAR